MSLIDICTLFVLVMFGIAIVLFELIIVMIKYKHKCYNKEIIQYDFYLAGPMRGLPDNNIPAFMKAAQQLRNEGFTVWNPAEHEIHPEWSFAKCMQIDLNAVIHKCRAIALLPGWRESLGANTEALVAFTCDKPASAILYKPDKEGIWLSQINLDTCRLPYGVDGEMADFDPHNGS